MELSRRRLAQYLFAATTLSSLFNWPADAYVAWSFQDASIDAAAVVLAKAEAVVTRVGTVRFHVIRTIAGSVSKPQLSPLHGERFGGDHPIDGGTYLLLLDPQGEPFVGSLTADGLPAYSCGVNNTLLILDGKVKDPYLFDHRTPKQGAVLKLSDAEAAVLRIREGN